MSTSQSSQPNPDPFAAKYQVLSGPLVNQMPPVEGHSDWSPRPITVSQTVDDRNHYDNLYCDWVIKTHGNEAIDSPPQSFLSDPRYPSYLYEMGKLYFDTRLQNEQAESIPRSNFSPAYENLQVHSTVPTSTRLGPSYSTHTDTLPPPIEDYRKMGKTEFFTTQREIIKCTQGFDCNVEAVMANSIILAKVHLDAISESRSGIAVAATDLDQAALMWAELVKRKEEEFAATKKKFEEEGHYREREPEKQKQGWKEKPGAGQPAAKRQKLAQDQDENLICALEVQDERAGKFYHETLNTASQSQALAGSRLQKGSEEIIELKERLTGQKRQLSELAERQLVVQHKLEEAAKQHTETDRKNEVRQQKIMDLLEKRAGEQE
ncbi:hypothetical protein C7212DRAFT_363956 [Tuber magnatum]|uniref:Uncharacterized protein n=1 Tax=Tuber magnatum TaxID=42249 RepID=A0A317SRQ4_9PEZI|nr:hypothetical protein C7212DRAFT_363956 [Tuber magnatum]